MGEIERDELMFFDKSPAALPIYLKLREKLPEICPETVIQVKKTQSSLINRHIYGAVSFLAARRKALRPDPFITVTIGLGQRLGSPRIDAASEPYPGRWTHHLVIGSPDEIDDELAGWLREAAVFAAVK